MAKHSGTKVSTPFWRDKRIIPIILQLLFVILVIGISWYFINNAITALKEIGIKLGFGFLKNTASFNIGESLIEYSATDTYYRAVLVGLLNTVRVSLLGIIFATIIGFIVGIARLSSNWLVQRLASLYIEIFRNTPLLVQIFIWFFAVFLALPQIKQAISIGNFHLSNKGITMPWFVANSVTTAWLLALFIGIVLFIVLWKVMLKIQVNSGKRKYPLLWSIAGLALPIVLTWLFTQQGPVNIENPVMGNFNFEGGYTLTANFLAIFLALTIYTATYIAEIVRGGIMSVSKGQIEASKALGVKGSTTMRLIILPQAIRIIIPPLTSQYLNLTKNSSLAIAAGFPDLVAISETINNQTGRAFQAVVIMIIVYLVLSILTSIFMNIFNKKMQIVER
ncbi:ABC transporter permease subunit [Aquibacillus koreensis]|uniref:ABC transporter permease subunit n=1 Tax=Aquibacillus koreensis TaxID=279446 RepID=A0A9X4AI78_9BACI|nr:ABC transporter permease subunit [Aquibacillus koreensis]MCT2534254.1 ABC transporter permease subunit [Aquibacillus koreensis]MDC3420701.1 ABC transporter permease subunit [Aquibacillus koreensis]